MFKLHVFAFLFVCHLTHSLPIESFILSDFDDIDTENYDIIVDQRQNGSQNFRIKVSGLSLVIPDDREQPQADPPQLTSLEQFATLLSPTSSVNNNQGSGGVNFNDFADLAALFDWKKNAKSSDKKPEDTQSRTKDIPTTSQLADDTRSKIKNIVTQEQRKYKLLVGEKYIIPILRFLKQQTEE